MRYKVDERERYHQAVTDREVPEYPRRYRAARPARSGKRDALSLPATAATEAGARKRPAARPGM